MLTIYHRVFIQNYFWKIFRLQSKNAIRDSCGKRVEKNTWNKSSNEKKTLHCRWILAGEPSTLKLTIFEKPYICVHNFWSKIVFVENTRLLEHSRYRLTVAWKSCSKDVFRGPPFGFSLISSFCTLIKPNYKKNGIFGHFLTFFDFCNVHKKFSGSKIGKVEW